MNEVLVAVGLAVWVLASIGYGLFRRRDEIKEARKRAHDDLVAARKRARVRVRERDVEEP